MLCEICKKNTANVHFKQVVNGVSQEVRLCEECAKSKGISITAPLGLTDLLMGLQGTAGPTEPPEGNKVCAVCHMRLADFRKTHRLGCPECYGTFRDELAQMIDAMHRDVRHVGKVPSCARLAAKVATLEQALEAAVREQRFEEAASLRDRILAVKKEEPDSVEAVS